MALRGSATVCDVLALVFIIGGVWVSPVIAATRAQPMDSVFSGTSWTMTPTTLNTAPTTVSAAPTTVSAAPTTVSAARTAPTPVSTAPTTVSTDSTEPIPTTLNTNMTDSTEQISTTLNTDMTGSTEQISTTLNTDMTGSTEEIPTTLNTDMTDSTEQIPTTLNTDMTGSTEEIPTTFNTDMTGSTEQIPTTLNTNMTDSTEPTAATDMTQTIVTESTVIKTVATDGYDVSSEPTLTMRSTQDTTSASGLTPPAASSTQNLSPTDVSSPDPTSTGSEPTVGSGGGKDNSLAIGLGVTFSILGALAIGLGVAFYVKKRRDDAYDHLDSAGSDVHYNAAFDGEVLDRETNYSAITFGTTTANDDYNTGY